MKNLKVMIFALLAVSMLFAACKKDDDDESDQKNQMTIAGTEYDFSQGVIENYGTWSSVEAYNFDVTLLTSGFTIHEINGEIDSISGIGSGIVFELFSSDSTDLAVGEYVYDADASFTAGTFNFAGAVVNYNADTEEGIEYDITEGTVTVSQNGGTYELTIDCKTDGDEVVTGYYKGSLKKYDYSDDKKSATIKNRTW
jgi:hypothetical protein